MNSQKATELTDKAVGDRETLELIQQHKLSNDFAALKNIYYQELGKYANADSDITLIKEEIKSSQTSLICMLQQLTQLSICYISECQAAHARQKISIDGQQKLKQLFIVYSLALNCFDDLELTEDQAYDLHYKLLYSTIKPLLCITTQPLNEAHRACLDAVFTHFPASRPAVTTDQGPPVTSQKFTACNIL